ncbi:MAG TPA: 30S ribosomal protein S6 [Alphaproteobacteria bacterium]|nr:30S ribosomal protein S6 [Alphaproteobacteria bacterium]
MPLYESIFIARQDIPATQVETLTAGFADIVRTQGGEVKKTEQWGLRNLSYRIKKNKKGHYVMFNLDAPPAAVAELERNLRINEDILRFLTVRVEEHEEGPSAILRKDEREERGERDHGDRPRRPRRDEPAATPETGGEA